MEIAGGTLIICEPNPAQRPLGFLLKRWLVPRIRNVVSLGRVAWLDFRLGVVDARVCCAHLPHSGHDDETFMNGVAQLKKARDATLRWCWIQGAT